MRLYLCPTSLHHTLPLLSHPVPQDPWLPLSSSWAGMEVLVVGEDVVLEPPVCVSLPMAPGGGPAVSQLHPGSAPQLCGLWDPCRAQDRGTFAPGAQDKDRQRGAW